MEKDPTFKKVSQCLQSKILINIQNLMGDQQQNRWVHLVGLLDHQLALVQHYLTKREGWALIRNFLLQTNLLRSARKRRSLLSWSWCPSLNWHSCMVFFSLFYTMYCDSPLPLLQITCNPAHLLIYNVIRTTIKHYMSGFYLHKSVKENKL